MTVTVCTACVGEPAPASKSPADALPYEVEVSASGAGFRSQLAAGEFELVLDAGRALGGEQSGPSPVQAFISSIVACTQITLQVVAKEAGVELPAIRWRGWGVFDARRLLSGADADPRFQRITVQGRVAGSTASQAQLDDLAARTGARCPISQSLHPGIRYELSLELEGAGEA